MMNMDVVVLGAGITGIATAYRLKELGLFSTIYEKDDTYGGLCNSFQINGFTLDIFAHISFDVSTTEWLEDETDCFAHEPEALNFDNGRWLRHPVQNIWSGYQLKSGLSLLRVL